MTNSIRNTLLTISLIVFSLPSFPASAQVDKQVAAPSAAVLATELHSGDAHRISDALGYIPWNDTEEGMVEFRESVDPLVATGMIAALDDQADELLSTYEGNYDAYPIEDLLDPLMFYVAALEEKRAVPVLLKATQFGNTPAHGLAAFGPDILPVILDYIESPERNVSEIGGGLIALVRTVEKWRPLEPSTHSELKEFSVRYMEGYVPEHLTDDPNAYQINWNVFLLASALGDADLKEKVGGFVSTDTDSEDFSARTVSVFAQLALNLWHEPSR